jgi:hypothetical protein
MGLSGNVYKILVRKYERKDVQEGLGLCGDNSKCISKNKDLKSWKFDVAESGEHSLALVQTVLT